MADKFQNTQSVKDSRKLFEKINFLQKVLGVENREKLVEKKEEMKKLVNIVDCYNEIFGEYFWIAHESISLEMMEEAIEVYNNKGIHEAEQFIADYYNKVFNDRNKIIFNSKNFSVRKSLFQEAYADYLNENYYAAIPIFLMLTDGIVSDKKGTGLAADKTDYNVWDSISGLNGGMEKIAKIYNRTRTKTNNEEITLPYRNGILHGRDLNYSNYLVATKCLALIFYVYDWCKEVENEETRIENYNKKKREIENTSLKDILKIGEQNTKTKNLIKEWEENKRDILEIKDSNIKLVKENTPEYSVISFFEYINNGNYGSPTQFLPTISRGEKTDNKIAGELKEYYKDLKNIEILKLEVNDTSAVQSKIKILLSYEYDNKDYEYEDELILNYEINGKNEIRLLNGGRWKIMFLYGLSDKMKFSGKEIEK